MRHTAAALMVGTILVLRGAAGSLAAGQSPAPPAMWPDGAAIEGFLKEARVTDRKTIGTGITKPEKVTLELDGQTRFAVQKEVEKTSDSWKAEVAAYELDKLLGTGHVPPTVARSFRGRRACLQLWVEGSTLEKFTATPPDLDKWREQVSVMWLFDDLVANNDRHLGNVIITEDFRLAFIDNSKSFRIERTLLNNLDLAPGATQARYWMVPFESKPARYPVRYPPGLIERLQSLTDDQIRDAIGRYVEGDAMRRLLERRRLILKRLEGMAPQDPINR